MVYTGWASFAGVELVNSSRAAAYAPWAGIVSTPDLAASLGDAPYLDPAADGAAWYDPFRPESVQFAGLVGVDFVGASTGSVARQWTELLGDGGVPGAARRASKEIMVKAIAFASTDAGMSYGLAWLNSVLRGSACGLGCTGDVLCVYAAEPARPLLTVGAHDPCGVPTGVPDPGWSPITGGDTLQRTLYDVVLVEPPEVTRRTRLGGGYAHEISFTVRAGVPHWYSSPWPVARDHGEPDDNAYRDMLPDYDPWTWQFACPQPAGCLDLDPYCNDGPAAPVLAPAPPDPCFPNNPANNPPGQPNRHRFNARRSVLAIPFGSGPDWAEKVPVIQVRTGREALHRLILRWYDNPTRQPCGPGLDPCYACVEINVPWLPPSVTLTLDGRTRRAVVDCPGPGGLLEPRVYGPSGGPFEWPVFECSSAMCLEVIVDADRSAIDLAVDVELAYREDAI
jgi:hypothetical protein